MSQAQQIQLLNGSNSYALLNQNVKPQQTLKGAGSSENKLVNSHQNLQSNSQSSMTKLTKTENSAKTLHHKQSHQ